MRMSEHLGVTESVHRAIAHAREAARTYSSRHVRTEHLLLGLFGEKRGVVRIKQNFAAQTLISASITHDRVREQLLSRWKPDVAAGAEVEFAFDPRSKNVVVRMQTEARRLGDDYVGTEHLLLSILGEQEGGAAQIFSGLGVDPQEVRERVIDALGVSVGGRARSI